MTIAFKINGQVYYAGCYADGSFRTEQDTAEIAEAIVNDIDPNWNNSYQVEFEAIGTYVEEDRSEILTAYIDEICHYLTSLCPDGIYFGYSDVDPGDLGFYSYEGE